jgi:probable FeS assembly SUF system protein SufT
MHKSTTTKLNREIITFEVPIGNEITLPKDTEVTITQNLGGSLTIIANDKMLRVSEHDADALGLALNTSEHIDNDPNLSLEQKIWLKLKTCYDPEIPINIVDLGLIYAVDITPVENAKFDVTVKMTLTAPGCGMGPMIAAEAKQKIAALPQVNSAVVEMIFDPPWDRSRISEQAKLELGIL